MLIWAALIWIGVHIGIAGSGVREVIAGRVGERGFRIRFSLLSVAALVFLIVSFNRADTTPLWFAPDWLRWLL
ncbi:MAG TPA: NnrU family protein, partial [Trebonia sp.]|nr:NnrU family protein [Trebonia sp.]